MQDHHALRVYEAAQKLAREVYALTPSLPPAERFSLADQLQRAAVSVPSDIAEGSGRATPRDFCNCLDRALGSAREVECQLVHARDTGLVPGHATRGPLATCTVVQRMLTRLIISVRRRGG
jgi:four helix bundle protein